MTTLVPITTVPTTPHSTTERASGARMGAGAVLPKAGNSGAAPIKNNNYQLLQVVLFGQPELDATLARDEFRQLRQRITFSYQLRPLDVKDCTRYLNERLAVAGYRGEPLFAPRAIRRLVRGSGGIPRLINILAHKALYVSLLVAD